MNKRPTIKPPAKLPPDPADADLRYKESELHSLMSQEKYTREHIADLIKEREIAADTWASLRNASTVFALKRRDELKIEMERLTEQIKERRTHYRRHDENLVAHLNAELQTIIANEMAPEYQTPVKAILVRQNLNRVAALGAE